MSDIPPTKPWNRREFLKTTGASLALAAVAPAGLSAEIAPAKKRGWKKGYFLSSFPGKLSLLEKFTMLKDAGFDGVEPPSHLDQAEVLKACEATGLKIASVSCGAYTRPFSSANPSVRQRGLEGLLQGLRDAKAYGATSVLVVAGIVDEKTSYADAYTRTQAEIRKAIPLAEELGVKMAIENVWNQFLLSPLEAARYVDEFKSPAVGWHFDIGNVITYGWPEQWIRILGSRIQKLHFKEYSRTKRDGGGPHAGFKVEYLEGDNNWPAVMKALDEIGYQGWAIAEPAWKPEGVEMKQRLKTIAEKMDKILSL